MIENAEQETVTPEDQLIQRVTASRTFENTPALRKLLVYLWDRRFAEVNEYAIAVEALGRRADFDPRTDAAVRVQVARLRQRLKEFYTTEGASESSQIVIQHGSHALHIVSVNPGDELEVPGLLETSPTEPNQLWTAHLLHVARSAWIPLAAILLAVLSWTGGMRWHAAHHPAEELKATPAPWADFLDNHSPVRVVVPNPVFFVWNEGPETLMVRDPSVNEFSDMNTSARLRWLSKEIGTPTLAQDYTVNTDTRASFRLAEFLLPHGAQVNIANSSTVPPEAFDHENLIFLGTFGILSPFRDYLDKLHFAVPDHKQYIIDTEPVNGKTVQYGETHESAARLITPGVIGFLPGRTPNSHIVVLAGYHTSSLATYITSPTGIADVQRFRAAHKNCRFFGAIVLSEVDGINPLRSWIVDFRALPEGK